MSLIKELRQKANQIKVEGKTATTPEAQRKLFYEEHTKPALKSLFKYLSELKEHLDVIQPEIAASYEIPNIGSINTLAQDYAVQIDSSNRPTNIKFVCNAVAVKQMQRNSVKDEPSAQKIRDLFNQIHLPFSEWPMRSASGAIASIGFEFTLKVPISIQFIADINNMMIYMITANLEGFNTLRNRIHPTKINDAWMDRLGLYLLRRGPDPNIALLSEEQRQKLREQLGLTS